MKSMHSRLKTCLLIFSSLFFFNCHAAVVSLDNLGLRELPAANSAPISFFDDAEIPSTKDLSSLNSEERYAVMLTALQTGEIKGAISLAESITSVPTFAGNTHVNAVLVIAKILNGQTKEAQLELDSLQGKDSYEKASVMLARTLYALQEGNHAQAEALVNELISLNPKHAYALVLRAHIATEQERFDLAHQALEQALRLNPRMRIALYSAGNLATREARYGDAITYFDRVLGQKGLACSARNGKANALIASGRYQEVGALLEPCLSLPESLLLYSVAYVQLGMLDQAWEKLAAGITSSNRSALSLAAARLALKRGDLASVLKYTDVKDIDHLFLNSIAKIGNGDYKAAKSQLQLILQQNENSDVARVMLWVAQVGLGEEISGLDFIKKGNVFYPFAAFLHALSESSVAKAEQYLRAANGLGEAVSFDEVTSASLRALLQNADKENLMRGNVYYLLDSPRIAKKYFLLSAQKDGDFISPYMLGVLNSKESNLLDAEKNAVASLKLEPNFFAAQVLLADTSLRQGKLEQALASYEKSLHVRSEAFVAIKAGMIAERIGRYPQAEQYYRKAVLLQPNNYMTYNQLAWYLGAQNKNLQEAIGFAQKALTLSPGSANVLDTLGWLYYLNGSLEQAKNTLEKAMSSNADVSSSVLYHLGMVEQSLNNSVRATALFEQLVKRERPSKYTEDAKRQLLVLQKQ